MTSGQLVNCDKDANSVARMQPYYDRKLIPAEKKPFLIDDALCSGPYMAVDGGQYILDAASQIASLGLGFNAGAMFGAAQLLATWTGNDKTPAITQVRHSLEELLRRKLGWDTLSAWFCNSGAEAVESALGICFEQRKNRAASKVIAFEGSFHGRMMVALAATWNIKKREPFQWPEIQSSFVPYPEMDTDDVNKPRIPAGWLEDWSAASRPGFEELARDRYIGDDDLLNAEVVTLLRVRELLEDGNHYAVLLEPMQCEGGDRYSSARFHQALNCLVRAYATPLIYDEIQTGLGLGGDFFWHRKFDLRDHQGHPISPDHVVIAKKAQTGAVLSRQACPFVEQLNAASLARGFIQASMMDQFREEIDRIEARTRIELDALMQEFGEHLSRPRVCGLSFAFDFDSPQRLQDFVNVRFQCGLLYYPAGERSARFRFNLAFRGEVLDVVWEQIRQALRCTLESESPSDIPARTVNVPDKQPYFEFHNRFISAKLNGIQNVAPLSGGAHEFIRRELERLNIQAEVVFLTESNWPSWRQQVWDLQGMIYEPLRQTAIEKFDQLIEAENSIAFAVVQGKSIVAMAFAAPPSNFPEERGLADDAAFQDPQVVYMLDLTVLPEFRGKLGRIMKQAITLAAQSKGLVAIQGRNRDRLARGMWAINLSLGSYCIKILEDDYVDDYPHRDCFMYRCDLDWKDEPLYLSNGVHQPLEAIDLTDEFCRVNLPLVNNKLTLSNFVSGTLLLQLDRVFGLVPERLRHGYTASGMSECVDKIVKTLWLKRNPATRMIVIGDSFFGHGSFLSRCLSGVNDDLFDCVRVPVDEKLVEVLKRELAQGHPLAVFVEPLGCLTGKRIRPETLVAISQTCRELGVPLVSHDSAGLFHRYVPDAFLPAALEGYCPDAVMALLGGQMAICFMTDSWFEPSPLMFISTWDGDALSLAQFDHALTLAGQSDMPDLMQRFQERLVTTLENQGVTEYALTGGVGWFQGQPGPEFARLFRQPEPGRFISCPSPGAVRKFLGELENESS